MIALLYSLGISTEEMLYIISDKYKEISSINARNVFTSAVGSFIKNELALKSLIDGRKIEKLVANVLEEKQKSVEDIKKALAIISCDTISTKEIVFLSKEFDLNNTERVDYLAMSDIPKAVRASMSFPGVITPCDYENYNLIDGGTVNNLPTKILKDMGAEKVLGVSFKLNEYIPKDDILAVSLRAADIFSILNMSVAEKYLDLHIALSVPDTGLLDIQNVNSVFEFGYNQTIGQRDLLLKKFNT